jgi:hypothetical protein
MEMKLFEMISTFVLVLITIPAAFGENPPGDGQPRPTAAQVRMSVQEICPVSGQQLGSHGVPVEVKIGDEHLFLCCQGCASGQIKREHWARIHANFAKAQGICPVMKHALPANAKWTIIEGQIIYVCCPPCTKKIEAAPETYLKTVDELYRKSLAATTARSPDGSANATVPSPTR